MEKNLKQELELLRKELGTPAADERLKRIENVYTSEEDQKLIGEYIVLMLNDIGVRLDNVEKKVQDLCSSLQGFGKNIGYFSN